MKVQRKFLAIGAAPILLAAIGGAAAFTAGNDTLIQTGTSVENIDYLHPATGTTAVPVATFTANGVTVKTKYGHLPEWYIVKDGSSAVPSSVLEAGDILYVDSFANDSTDAGDVISGLAVRANIVNLPAVNNSYAACMLPAKIWASGDDGTTWTDITDVVMGVSAGEPYYIDCNTGQIDFTLRSQTDADFVLTIEQGGSIVPHDGASPAVAPQWVFQSTPIAN